MRLAFPLATTDGIEARITAGFQSHLDRSTPSKTPGADIVIGRPANAALTEGAAVVAAAGGIVRRVQPSSRGLVVELDHGDNIRTVYRHTKNKSFATVKGLPVLPGQKLAEASFDPKDASKTPHLHFELRAAGRLVDPAPLLALANKGPAGTLPPEVPDAQVQAAFERIRRQATSRATDSAVREYAPWLLLIWFLYSRN